MAFLHLIRHGQADSAGATYDRLTSRGYEQATMLAQYYANAGVQVAFTASGTLVRQKETARCFRETYLARGKFVPEPLELPPLNEFSPDLWLRLAGQLRERDAEFSRLLDRFRLLRDTSEKKAGLVFAKLTGRILTDWLGQRFLPGTVDSFEDFRGQVRSVVPNLPRLRQDDHAFLFTSGTPISILVADALGLQKPEHLLRLIRWIYNCSVSTLYLHRGNTDLIGFNSVPHIPNPKVRTLV